MNTFELEEPCIVNRWVPCDNNEMQMKASFENNYLDHMSNLNITSNPSHNTLTTIACGVLSNVTRGLIQQFCHEGVSLVIFDFYGLSSEQSEQMVNEIRQGVFYYSLKNNEVPYSMALVLDLGGFRIMTGNVLDIKGKNYFVKLLTNEHVFVTNDVQYKHKCTNERIYVSSKRILQLKENDQIFLDYGKIELIVRRVDKNEVYCVINRGGFLWSQKSVHIPGISINRTTLTEEDEEHIRTGIKLKVDAIMIPGVRNGEFFHRVKKFVRQEKGNNVDLYAKIDNSVALENIDEIISNADGVFLNRPNLCMEVGHDGISLVQKIVLSKCIIAGKPTVTYGGFLSSMEYNNIPSSVEINDIINTVLDGTDCIYLDVTTRSPHQMHCVQYASTVCRQAEAAVWEQQLFSELKKTKSRIDPAHAISVGCVEVSLRCHTAAIIVITTSGSSAKLIARYRPRCPVLAVVKHGFIAKKISVYRNIVAVRYIDPIDRDWSKDIQNRTKFAMNYGKKRGLFTEGDLVLHMTCLEKNTGYTNTMSLFYVGDKDFV